MLGLLGLKASLKSVATGSAKLAQRNRNATYLTASSFDDKSNKVTFPFIYN